MPSTSATIEIPDTDLWATIFDRDSRPFPDSQVIYQDASTNRKYTYSTLRASTIAFGTALLTDWSWRKGQVLALFAQNCIDTPTVTWGTHFAGGIVSPANPAYTVRELAHHLRDSGAEALFTQKSLLPTALEAAAEAGIPKARVVLVGDGTERGFAHFQDMIRGKGKEELRVKLSPGKDLAYLVYSSGTTGLPKGVMLSHTNAVSNLFQLNSSEGTLLKWDQDKVLSVLPYYHIYGLQCLIHFPAYAGLTSLVMSAFDLNKFCSLIQNQKITYAYVAPPVVLHLAKNEIVAKYDLSSLRMITSGAAPLTKDLIHAVHKRLKTEVKQAYGLSETSPATHIQKKWDNGLGSCGPLLPNMTVKFMSADETEVGRSKEGEIWIKGPNVFLGYHNNEAATLSSITPDGFFKTGDIGYEDANGNLFITDRVKELIKYKGFQVAPAELEGVLMGMELVDDVAVIGIQDDSQATEVPLAFIVPAKGVARTKENGDVIAKWLATRVAGHKRLRGGVRFIDEVPKSASGKILRRILKDLLKEEGKAAKAKAKL